MEAKLKEIVGSLLHSKCSLLQPLSNTKFELYKSYLPFLFSYFY